MVVTGVFHANKNIFFLIGIHFVVEEIESFFAIFEISWFNQNVTIFIVDDGDGVTEFTYIGAD